jgi:hypothetical protein
MEVVNDDLVTLTGFPLKPHEWVQVQGFLTAADEQALTNRVAKRSGTPGNNDIQLLMGDVEMAMAKRMVKGWNLTKEVTQPGGEKTIVPIPFSTQAIEKLPRHIYRYILKRIDELNADPVEETDENFTKDAGGSSEGS